MACAPDGTASVCVPLESPARDETCNGGDDDCDGAIDESLGLRAACTSGLGECLREGVVVCAPDGVGTICAAAAGEPIPESCNGVDDDCDGTVDEGELCPDAAVRYAVPFFRNMFYVAQQSPHCGSDGLFQFWPVYEGGWLSPSAVGCDVDYRVWNGAGHFFSYPGGLASTWNAVVTPIEVEPCAPRGRFGWAETGLHYVCGDSVYRAPGVLVTAGVDELLGVMRDGRVVVRRGSVVIVIDVAGMPLGELDLAVRYAGTVTLLPTGSFDYENDVFVLGLREMPDGARELVVLRADTMNRIRQVRRVPISEADVTAAHFVLPDGTIFSIEPDPVSPGRQRIRRRGGDGSDAVVFREADVDPRFYIGAERRVIPFL